MRPLFSFFLALTAFIVYGQTAPTTYSIKGFLPFWKGATITLSVDGLPVDMQTLQQDVYSYTGQTPAVATGILELRQDGKPYFLPFFVEPGVIRIRDKGGKRLEVYGTPTNDVFGALTHRFDSLALNRGGKQLGDLVVTKKGLAKEFIRNNPHSIISLQLLNDYFFLNNSVDDTAYAALYQVLDPALQQTVLGRKIGKEAAFSGQSAPGVKAALLSLPDSSGGLRPVYVKGEYTLLHFWASWCIPCKKEMPELLSVYRRFAPLGLSITGVSLDQDLRAWKHAAARWPWKQLVDVGAFSGASARNYGIRVVPMSLLLDRDGTIIAKNLNLPELEKKLTELLEAKTF